MTAIQVPIPNGIAGADDRDALLGGKHLTNVKEPHTQSIGQTGIMATKWERFRGTLTETIIGCQRRKDRL